MMAFKEIIVCAITIGLGALLLWLAKKVPTASLTKNIMKENGPEIESFLRNKVSRRRFISCTQKKSVKTTH